MHLLTTKFVDNV